MNAFSWLSEFNHLQQKEHPYRVTRAADCQLTRRALPRYHTYIVQLGENLDAAEFEQATQSTAEYIYLNTLTPGASFFDECRSSASRDEGESRQSAHIVRSECFVQSRHLRTFRQRG